MVLWLSSVHSTPIDCVTYFWPLLLTYQCLKTSICQSDAYKMFKGYLSISEQLICSLSNLQVWPLLLAQVLPHPQLIFPSKAWFFGIYLNFQGQKSLKNQYLPQSESNSYQINSIKSCSSRSFQQHQRHIPTPPNFSTMI